jgi:hypothetical protein
MYVCVCVCVVVNACAWSVLTDLFGRACMYVSESVFLINWSAECVNQVCCG